MLPGRCGREDGFAAEEEEEQRGRRLHETIYDRRCQPSGAHGGCQSNEHVDFLIKLRMNAKSRKRLRGALAEPDVTKTRHLGCVKNILNRVGYIMPCEIINAEIPESCPVGT